MPVADTALFEIADLTPALLRTHLEELVGLLQACVEAGASIGYVLPFPKSDAEAFWLRKTLPALETGRLDLLVARLDGRIVGTAQLDADTMPNQPHRAEVRKLMVHPAIRRRGIARALMSAIEARARARGRTLLTLDTRTGDAAEPLYASIGYQTTGVIPGYCIDAITGAYDGTTIMYKQL